MMKKEEKEKPKKPVWPEVTGTLADRQWIEEAYTVKEETAHEKESEE